MITVLREAGCEEALLGIGLSHGITSGATLLDVIDDDVLLNRLRDIADILCLKGGSHAKFLESIAVWLDVTAPRYWWQQFDTYRIGVTKQSESTMHSILNRCLGQDDFAAPIPRAALVRLNVLVEQKEFQRLKIELPEGFLQRRIVCTNYKALRHIVGQRYDHRLGEWRQFCRELLSQLEHPGFVGHGDDIT